MTLQRSLVLPHTIAGLAEERTDAPAMVDVSGRSRTWAQFHTDCLRWAAAYRALGVEPGHTVVTMVPNCFEAYDAWLGLGWLRAIEVPANNMYRGEMLRYLIEDSGASVLVIAARYLDRLVDVAGGLTALRTVVVLDATGDLPELPLRVVTGAEFLGVDPATDLPGPEGHDVGALIYTSGTTGPSKGVLAPWAELQQSPEIMPPDLIEVGEPYYTVYPAFHLSGKCGLYNAAHFKAHLVIRESFSVSEFWNDIRTHGVRGAGLLGPMAAMLLAAPAQTDDADNPLEKLTMGPIIPAIEAFKERFGIKLVSTGYGMTEIGFPITSGWNPPNHRTCGRRREGSPGYDVRIVNEHDEPVPVGTVGELVVRSSEPWVLNSGYWHRPEKTAEAWRNGWFHTGDGFMEDEEGWLYFVDRTKDTLRRRGENISSFEVEGGLVAHPDVLEAAVVGVPSPLGEDDVKAVVVRRPDADLTPEALLTWVAPRLPRFMIPRYVEFVDSLPKTDGTFRVQKFMLREQGVTAATWDRDAARFVLPHD